MNKKIKVVLADDHALVLDGLLQHLADTEDITVVATAQDGRELLRAIEQHTPDVVVTDLLMPDMDGFTAIRNIRQRALPVRILVLTALADSASLQQVIELEVDGIVLKTDPPRQTIEAIHQVAAGQIVYPRAVRNWLIRRANRQRTGQASHPKENLTDREKDVLRQIAHGKTNQEIASELHLSLNTIKHHTKSIFRKLDVNNRTEAAKVFFGHRMDP